MTPPWGINWQSYHKDMDDMPHVQRMGYKAFTLYEWMWSDRGFMSELLAVARPDAIFLCRDHPLSEQKDDEWRNNPAQKGRNHADDWANKVQQGRVHTPLERTYFLGINEPDSNVYQRQIDQYNEAFCRGLAEHGLRAAAYSFGVGHPSTVNSHPDTLPDWSHYAASARAVLEGGHIVAVHEYGAPTIDGYGWGFWCNRLVYCPYPFDVVLDECGIDNGVVNSGELYGWAKFMSGEDYLQWLDGFQAGQAEREGTRKARIIAYNIFSYDHGRGDSKDWHSFDIRPLRKQLEVYPWTQAQNPTQPTQKTATTFIPSIKGSIPVNTPTALQPQPQPIDSDTNWQRVWPIVLDIEGDLSLDPNDPGNWYNGELVGTNHGISGAVWGGHYNIRELTKEQALNIYYVHYWQESGADELAWPLCLLHFDAYVQNEVEAVKLLRDSGGDPALYMADRIDWYTKISNWELYGRGWMRRCATMLRHMKKGS